MSDLLITNARLLDLAAGLAHENSSVRVEGQRTVDVGLGRALPAGDDVPRLDAGGRTLLPGLIDAHVHASLTTLDLAAGSPRERDAGGLDRGLAEALNAGLIVGPRVFRSGRVLSQTGGHGDTDPVDNEPHLCACHIKSTAFAHIADGPDAVRRAVREELKGGAHQIKIMAAVASRRRPTRST